MRYERDIVAPPSLHDSFRPRPRRWTEGRFDARWLAVALALAYGLLALGGRPQLDNSVLAFVPSDDARARTYGDFRDDFGDDEVLVTRVTGTSPAHVIQSACELEQALERDPDVERVVSLGCALEPESADADFDTRRTGWQKTERAHPLSRDLGLLSAADRPGGEWSLSAYAFAPLRAPERVEPTRERLEAARQRASQRSVRVAIAGNPLLNLALDEAARRVERINLPALAAVSAIFVAVLSRSLVVTLALLTPVGLGVTLVDSLLALAGKSTNLIVNIAKPLQFALLLASGIHLWSHWEAELHRGAGPLEASRRASAACWLPVATALLTTAVGFATLLTSELPPIRRFGWVAAGSVTLGMPLVLLVVPTFLSWARPRPSARRAPPPGSDEARTRPSLLARGAERLMVAGSRHAWLATALGVLGLGVGAWSTTQLTTDPHAIHYLAKDHALRRDHEALERAGVGLASLELVARGPEHALVERAAALGAFERELREIDGVRAVIRADAARDGARRFTLLLPTVGGEELDRYESAARRSFRNWVPSRDPASARGALASGPGSEPASEALRLDATGNYSLLLHTQSLLLGTLARSMLLGVLCMQGILLLLVRAPIVALAALVPNLLPVALGFLLMFLLDIPIDVGTSMTASVALGIAVDDTLHVLHSWQAGAVASTARRTGRAIVVSSLVIGAGFVAIVPSDFLPARHFGLLCAFAMGSALLADLLLLPALLRITRYRAAPSAPPQRA